MDKMALESTLWIAAPRERVLQAITDPAQVAQWFIPNLPGTVMQRDESGKLSILMGPMTIDLALLNMENAPQQVTLRSLPDQLLTAVYTLKEEKGGTQTTVTMTGFETLPQDAQRDRLSISSAGWEKALKNLEAYIAGKDLPHPQAFVGPLFGFWREPKKTLAIERSIWIKAPRERVWAALTDPQQIEKWFSPGTTWETVGEGVGSRLFVRDPETGAEMYTQIIDVIAPPHQLAMRSDPPPPETSQTTLYTLLEEEGGTRLTLTNIGYELMPEDTRWSSMEQNTFGFGMMLSNVKAVVEGEALPVPGGF